MQHKPKTRSYVRVLIFITAYVNIDQRRWSQCLHTSMKKVRVTYVKHRVNVKQDDISNHKNLQE